MSRLLKSDYEELTKFINSYSLSGAITNIDHLSQLKIMHKKVFSLANLVFALQNLDVHNSLFSKRAYDYLNECVSDLCSTMFMWINGAYKPSKLMLRSCIETFVKAILCNEDEESLKIKNLYEVFDIASKINFFTIYNNSIYFNKLNNQYAELCSTVHSGDIKCNAQLVTLNIFPSYDDNLSLEVSNRFIVIVETSMFLIISNFCEELNKMHHTVKDCILNGLSKKQKKEISERYISDKLQ